MPGRHNIIESGGLPATEGAGFREPTGFASVHQSPAGGAIFPATEHTSGATSPNPPRGPGSLFDRWQAHGAPCNVCGAFTAEFCSWTACPEKERA